VYYARELTHNLVSGTDLMNKGFDLFFSKNRFEVLKDSNVVATGTFTMLPKFDDHLINTTTVPTQVLKLSTDNKELMALHETFGHYNIRSQLEVFGSENEAQREEDDISETDDSLDEVYEDAIDMEEGENGHDLDDDPALAPQDTIMNSKHS
jgi:hypothetical protein